jgi:hypothetical protein
VSDASIQERMSAADLILQLRDLVERDRRAEATALARAELAPAPATSLPFAFSARRPAEAPRSPLTARVARVPGLTEAERTRVCYGDGFVDRLSPERWRLVYPGALRVLTLELPAVIDTVVSNGTLRAYAVNAPVWWDLWPTVDHLQPRARGGTNEAHNLACVSWWRNAAKADRTLDETGWILQPPGDPHTWDGLLGWFVDRVRRYPDLADDAMVRRYLRAATAAIGRPAGVGT